MTKTFPAEDGSAAPCAFDAYWSSAKGFVAPQCGHRYRRKPQKFEWTRAWLIKKEAEYPLPHLMHTLTHVCVSIGSTMLPK